MGEAISDVLPLAVGVMIFPVPVITVILMLFSGRARSNGPAFLLGWVVGLSVVSGVVYALSDSLDVGSDSGASDGASIVMMILGVVLLLLGARQWRSRPAPGTEPHVPKWMATIDGVTPVKAIGLGVVLSAFNPKNLLLTIGAAASVSQAGLSTGDAVIVLAVFVVVSSVGIAVPVIGYLLARKRAERVLATWKVWLEQNSATVMAVLFVVMGIVLFSKGLGPIST